MKKIHSIPAPAQAVPGSIREAYVEHGVEAFYRAHGAEYSNPHESRIRACIEQAAQRWAFDPRWPTLDLACGSGEATLALRALGFTQITGCDPYTGEAYTRRTGQIATQCRFEQIAERGLPGDIPYSLVVCSFALHLVTVSRLPALAFRLAEGAARLLAISPHKRPQIKPEWGWQVIGEFVHERVRTRFYHSAVQSRSLNTIFG